MCVCERETVCVSVVRPMENIYRKLYSHYGDLKVNLNYFIAAYTKSFQTHMSLHFKVLNLVAVVLKLSCLFIIMLHDRINESSVIIQFPRHQDTKMTVCDKKTIAPFPLSSTVRFGTARNTYLHFDH